MKNLLLFLLLTLIIACQQAPTEKSEPVAEPEFEVGPPPSEEELIIRLSPGLTADAQNQAEIDRNTLINLAIAKKLDLHATNTGIYYRILREGEGESIKWGDRLRVHYKGNLLNGQVFDSSYDRGQPLEFYVGNMIPAWNEGLQLIKPGGAIELYAPSDLAYGKDGFPDGQGGFLVPPNSILVFRVEVLGKL
ncbi:MAG: hypothetical protein DHS20C18_32700 [Saprospiraceae bacterium]|nr:MAG: hypothetical protein DHS20C18_32700 [Saprospiraceae bacterium]